MITIEILQAISHKLRSIIWSLIMIGLAFFLLASAILFYPEIIQYLFILAFFLIAFWSFLIAVKVNNIKESFDRVIALLPKTKKK